MGATRPAASFRNGRAAAVATDLLRLLDVKIRKPPLTRQLAGCCTPARMVSGVERSPKTNDPCRTSVSAREPSARVGQQVLHGHVGMQDLRAGVVRGAGAGEQDVQVLPAQQPVRPHPARGRGVRAGHAADRDDDVALQARERRAVRRLEAGGDRVAVGAAGGERHGRDGDRAGEPLGVGHCGPGRGAGRRSWVQAEHTGSGAAGQQLEVRGG
jgi:hypothetical protein